MIVASGIAMQFGGKRLFSDASVKFGGGNRYGLIGANGCGKSTFISGGGAVSSVGDHGSRTFSGSWTAALDRYPGTLTS